MPGSTSAGMAEKKASNAASPPAEAPTPTTGKGANGAAAVSAGAAPPTRASGGVVAWVVVPAITCSICAPRALRVDGTPHRARTDGFDPGAAPGGTPDDLFAREK
jgi:hypothetical protein